MTQSIYQALANWGYHHPLHPVFVHLTIGMVAGAMIFGLLAWLSQSTSLAQTAGNCIGLALISIIPTAVIGYADWQHFLGGVWIFPVRWKLILSAALFTVLFIAWLSARKSEKTNFGQIVIYFICFAMVAAIGYFGAELVHGKKMVYKEEPGKELVEEGAIIFARSCSICHFAETKDNKIGPGLKELFQQKKFPVSQWPATRESFEKQLRTPFRNMPSFEDFEDEQIDALIAYLKTH
jgi:uncharacterized membrane protein